MLSASLLMQMDDCKTSILYIILETPGSGSLKYLHIGLQDRFKKSFFYLPSSTESKNELQSSSNISFWNDEHVADFSLNKIIEQNSFEESFLFFSPYIDISDQFELTISQLTGETNCEIARVISFIDANELINTDRLLQPWLDAAAHFSDAMCVTNRSNQNGKAVGDLFKKYEDMRYPLETYVISHSKKGKINSILNPTAKRITHIFDAPEMLDDQDTPLQDPYLKILANGKREKAIPTPFIR